MLERSVNATISEGMLMAGGTFKGRYTFCIDCKHRRLKVVDILDPTKGSRYDCIYTHKQVRKSGNCVLERHFKMCGLIEYIDLNIGRKYYSVGVLQDSVIEEWTFTNDMYDKRRKTLGVLFWTRKEAEDYLAYKLRYNLGDKNEYKTS